jgi:hypothetical protein
MWVKNVQHRRTFAFRRYESVSVGVLGSKLGVMNHSARVDLLKWVKEQYR